MCIHFHSLVKHRWNYVYPARLTSQILLCTYLSCLTKIKWHIHIVIVVINKMSIFNITEAGRRALCTKKHVQILHRFCSQCPDEPEFDGLLARVCAVITLCLKHQALPVPVTSPASFNLNPILKGKVNNIIRNFPLN